MDGHHRCAASAALAEEERRIMMASGIFTGNESSNYVLGVLFDDHDVSEYHRHLFLFGVCWFGCGPLIVDALYFITSLTFYLCLDYMSRLSASGLCFSQRTCRRSA